MATIRHEIWIDAPISTVYELLSAPDAMSSWWDEQTPVQTDQGEGWEHTPGPEHGKVRMLILERERNKLFKWQCISSHSEDVPASAWTGTTMTFALGDRSSSPIAQEKWAKKFPLKTVLTFAHDGWDDSSRFLPFCNSSWASVLQQLSDKASGKR